MSVYKNAGHHYPSRAKAQGDMRRQAGVSWWRQQRAENIDRHIIAEIESPDTVAPHLYQ